MYKVYEELLAKNNETSYQVAKATGISTVTLTSWKQGVYEPKIDKLMLIADHFKVPVTVFLDAKREEVKPD